MTPTLIDTDGFFLRKGRKQWRCNTIRRDGEYVRGWDAGPIPPDHSDYIDKGTLHVEYVGEAGPFESGKRYCLACAKAAGIIDD